MAQFLPTSQKEAKALGWQSLDVILFTGDAYIDHPSFGVAIIARLLEKQGLKVAIVPQPNWRDDLRDFKKFGRPNLFFGITSGNMDSMINHYTANKRLRSDDAYTPGGKAGQRPDYAAAVYTKILKKIYPDVPVILATAVSHETGLSFSIDSDLEKSWIRADRYLEKGIRPEQLDQEVMKLLKL